MSVINYRRIVDYNSGMIEHRFCVPIESVRCTCELTAAEKTIALAKLNGDKSIWIKAGLLMGQIERIERLERKQNATNMG